MPSILSPWFAVALACLPLAACSNDGPPRGGIRGQVTLGGAPLKAGRVLFVPVAPTEGPSASAAVVDGKYELPSREGPVVGKNRVELEAAPELGFSIDDDVAFAQQQRGRPLPRSPIPPEFGAQSTQFVDVQAGNDNAFDLSVPIPPRR